MAKYEVVANIQVIVTVDDDTRTVDSVFVCDDIPMFSEWHDVWRLGPNYSNDVSDIEMLEPAERARYQRIAEEADWPPLSKWVEG